jgi:hypothetical protein
MHSLNSSGGSLRLPSGVLKDCVVVISLTKWKSGGSLKCGNTLHFHGVLTSRIYHNEGPYCLHLTVCFNLQGSFFLPTSCWFLALLTIQPWWRMRYVPTKHRSTSAWPQLIISQKIEHFVTAAVRASNPTSFSSVNLAFDVSQNLPSLFDFHLYLTSPPLPSAVTCSWTWLRNWTVLWLYRCRMRRHKWHGSFLGVLPVWKRSRGRWILCAVLNLCMIIVVSVHATLLQLFQFKLSLLHPPYSIKGGSLHSISSRNETLRLANRMKMWDASGIGCEERMRSEDKLSLCGCTSSMTLG